MTKMTMSRAFGVYPVLAAACIVLAPLLLSFAAIDGALDDLLSYPATMPADCNVTSSKVLGAAYVFYRVAAAPMLILAFVTVYKALKHRSGHEAFFIGLTTVGIIPFVYIWVAKDAFLGKTFLPAVCASASWSSAILLQFLLFGVCAYFLVGAAVTSGKFR